MKANKNHRLETVMYIATLLLLSLLASPVNTFGAEASDSNNNLFNMSIEQLMDVGVYAPATLTEKDPLKTPASVTIITSEDIARTPARNILDLMEIYVPGMLYMNHSVGPEPGMRGIIADKPYKFLVNVDGINVNIKSTYGARLELLNWELSDIDRIEVVRGPGSVTYGPGAIGGVINIYTKSAKQAKGLEIGGQYWGKYDSVGEYASYGYVKDDLELYSYFSVVDTRGISPDLFATDKKTASYYFGKPGGPYFPVPASTYMGDFFNQPQVKAHLDIHFHDNWRFWARYATESSELMQGSARQTLINGLYKDIYLSQFRYFQLALENQLTINKDWNLKSTFGLSSTDIRDIQQKWDTSTASKKRFDSNSNGKDNLRDYGMMYSEWKYSAQFMLNYTPDDKKIKAALGYEISYDLIRPSWGKNKDNGLRLGSKYGIISGPTSAAYGPDTSAGQVNSSSTGVYYPVGNGFEAVDHAIIGELNLELTPKTTMILSGRFDKNTYTDLLFSPRLALIQELRKDEYLKFIIGRSVRMNTMDELYINNKNGVTNFPEKLDTLELIYTKKANEHWSYQASAFWNKNTVIAWDGTSAAAPLGTLELFGIEAEMKYQKENFTLGINHSVVKQLSWKLAKGITTSGISNSDYYYYSTSITIGSHGNDLSNWANQSTKLYTNIGLIENKLDLHGDVEAFWGFQGYKDGLDAFEKAGGNAASIKALQDHHAFDAEVKANLSLTWHVNKSADFMVFVQNIPVFGDNKRYSYTTGQKLNYPDKTAWVEEPMVVGFTYKIRF